MNFHLCLSIPINSLWEALDVKARSPDKFMDVRSVKVSDEDGFLVRSMTLTSNNTTVRERIRIDRVASEIECQLLHRDTVRRRVLSRVKLDVSFHLASRQGKVAIDRLGEAVRRL